MKDFMYISLAFGVYVVVYLLGKIWRTLDEISELLMEMLKFGLG